MKASLVFFFFIPFVYGQETFFLRPNLQNRGLVPVRSGTQIKPLCNPDLPETCLSQWSQFAHPLSQVSGATGEVSTHFYLPIIQDLQPIESVPEENIFKRGWRRIFGLSSKKTRYYQRPHFSRIRAVSGHGEDTFTREGDVVFVPESSISVQARDVSSVPESRDESVEDGNGNESGPVEEEEIGKSLSVEINQPTVGVEGVLARTKTLPEGCVVIDKQEAGFCFECGEQKINVTRTDEQLKELNRLMIRVREVYDNLEGKRICTSRYKVKDSSGKRVTRYRVSGVQERIEGKIAVDKICSPHESLKAVISNFNRTCKPSDFNNFFPQLYCQTCQSGIPPEVMLAKMTIESSGMCKGENSDSREISIGLFQVNAKEHSCKGHRRNTRANRQCLLNMENNTEYGIQIFKDFYRQVNPSKLVEQTKGSVCSSDWPSLSVQQRDSWRRAVSAYNGGPRWLHRSIQAVEEVKEGVDPTRLYTWRNKQKVDGAAKLSDASWQDLRHYYFKERFASARSGQLFGASGRTIECTISNLAHTEAILGSEIKGSPPGLVEYWDQYVKQYVKQNKPECPE